MSRLIRHAQRDDIDAVHDLAASHNDQENPEAGFLVSAYSNEDYDFFLDGSINGPSKNHGVVFLVCEDTEKKAVVGFLIAYSSNFIEENPDFFSKGTTESRIIDKFGLDQAFFVIKQVAVARNAIGDGIGTQLYNALFHGLTASLKTQKDMTGSDPAAYSNVTDVFVAVVRLPENARSSKFHRSYGFLPVLTYGNEFGDPAMEREVLHVTAQTAMQHKKDTFSDREPIEGLRTALSSARELYLHEDNLNWTKLNYLSQYFAFIIAGQFVLPNIEVPIPQEWLFPWLTISHLALTGLCIYVVVSFSAKIRSGLTFMASHKRSALIAESKLQLMTSAFYPAISRVPRTSRTVILIDFAKILFTLIVIISFVFNGLAILFIRT